MAVRIYAFAKDLGLENKDLLDICEKVGIKGKGSALASLDDDEIGKIKKFMSGADSGNGASAPPVKKPTSTAAPIPPAPELRRDDMQPVRSAPLRDLDDLNKRKNSDERTPLLRRDAKKRSAVNVSIAAMPEVKQPSMTPKSEAVKIQKPDIALPQGALLKARKTGVIAPLEEFTNKNKTKTPKFPKKPGAKSGAIGGATDTVVARDSAGKVRGRQKADGTAFDTDLGSTRQHRPVRRTKDASKDRDGEEEGSGRRRSYRRRGGQSPNTAAPRKDKVTLQLPCSVRTFSEAAGVSAVQVLLALPKLGEIAPKNINSDLSDDMVELLIDHLNVTNLETRQAESLEDNLLDLFGADSAESLVTRPPVVTFLGHVDHGKTSLLDAIIGTDVVSGEAGGITQHIRAYQVMKSDKRISFVDTPGHEAFTEMRARGANVTDIAVLVVAADDGIMPQTDEAISHAKAAGVPIIVALNKIDLPGANPEKIFQELAARDLLPSEWGGQVEVVKTSATKKTGIDDLLDTILLSAEMNNYQADPTRPAFGTCLEAEQQPGRGVVVKMIIQGGTLNLGDIIVCGAAHGRVKAMYDTLHPTRKIAHAPPSMPVNLTGLDIAPNAGDKFHVLSDIIKARELTSSRENRSRQLSLGGTTTRVSLEDFQKRLESGTLGKTADIVTLNLIIRADVRGSIEAIQKELSKIEHPEVRINILQALVGGVTIADVRLAQASQGVIIGFSVVPDEASRSLADELQVEIRRYDIIYKVTDDIRATLEGRLKPEKQIVEQGMAMVLQVFNISKVGAIAGCRVMRGTIQRDCRMRIVRDSRVIGEYAIDSLKREKDDAREVQRGMECGIRLAGFNDIKEGDTLEAFKVEEIARTL